MAFKQLTGISFIADSVEDLKKLPSKRGLGASCFVVEDGKEYKCNSKGEWKPYSPTIIIEGGNVSGGSSDPNYYGGNGRTVQANWEQVDPNAPDYIRNRPFFNTTKVLSTQTLNITEPFTIITREELDWPEDFFNYSYDQPNEYAVYKNLDLLGNWQNETIIEHCQLEETTDENGRVIRWIGDEWFENAKTFLMYYYDDEPETIYIKTNRKGQFVIKNIYKDHSESFFASNPSITQNDWADSSKNSSHYIHNKPFYHELSLESYEDLITLEPNENQDMIQTTLSLNDYNLWEIFNNFNYAFNYNIKVIKTDLNGNQTEYIYEVQNIFDFEEPPIDKYVKWIGDFPSIFGYDIDDISHFCLYYFPDEDCNTLYFEGEAGTYEFYLYSPEVIKKIEEKFLPESRQKQADWNQIDYEAPDYIHNKPIYANKIQKDNIKLEILQENGISQSFSRELFDLGGFLTEPYLKCDIHIEQSDGITIETIRNTDIDLSTDENDRERYEVRIPGGYFYCYVDELNTIYYKGCRFGSFYINTYTEELRYLSDLNYVSLKPLIQSSWNENDETSTSYIQNRPFCFQEEYESYLDLIDTSLGNQFSRNEYNLYNFLRPNNQNQQYKITTNNGNEYTLEIQHSYEYGYWNDIINNYDRYVCWYGDMPSFLGGMSVCGFSFYCFPDEDLNTIYYEGPDNEIYTIYDYKEQKIQQIDKKFIPTVQLNLPELIDTDNLEEPALTLASTLNSLITTLQNKYIIE